MITEKKFKIQPPFSVKEQFVEAADVFPRLNGAVLRHIQLYFLRSHSKFSAVKNYFSAQPFIFFCVGNLFFCAAIFNFEV